MNWYSRQVVADAAILDRQRQVGPQSYYDIGAVGSPDTYNDECTIFLWIWHGPGSLSAEEASDPTVQTHENMFDMSNANNMYYGRFNTCKHWAGLVEPWEASKRGSTVPEELISDLVRRFSKFGINKIYKSGYSQGLELIWQG